MARFPQDVWKRYRNRGWSITVNSAFDDVVRLCSTAPRSNDSVWITPDMLHLYSVLRRAGLAWSFEVYDGGELIAGEFGLPLGGTFFCESKFHLVPGAGNFCTGASVLTLADAGFRVYDAQYGPSYLHRFSARGMEVVEAQKFAQMAADASEHRFAAVRQGGPAVPRTVIMPSVSSVEPVPRLKAAATK